MLFIVKLLNCWFLVIRLSGLFFYGPVLSVVRPLGRE